MTNPEKSFETFVHPETKEAYLFAYEDYLSDRELEMLWEDAVRIYTEDLDTLQLSPPGIIIDSIVREIGLKRPEDGSPLALYINELIYTEQSSKEDHKAIVRELGFDPGEEIISLPRSA